MSGSKEGYLFIYKQVVSCPNKQHSFESFTCLVRKNASRLCLVQINRVLWNLSRVWCEKRLFIYIQASCVLSKKNSILLNLLRVGFEIMLCIYIYIYKQAVPCPYKERSFEPFMCLDQWNMSHTQLFSRAEPNAACICPS